MIDAAGKRGGAPVGYLTELTGAEATSVLYLRLWGDGPGRQADVWADLTQALGPARGRAAMKSFEQLVGLCARHGRRPLMRHAIDCKCIGADEACFANFVAAATDGDREDALLIATLLVRADIAPMITSLACDFGLALKRMHLAEPRALAGATDLVPTVH
ncbi:hypothetical protein KX928_15715 [Roseobacter sp. YSTF-M11]|uniref:Uncharacterized protein n=1 Tax=Roseobacter insulae TaxID=2859783 RepID=A0A9X1FYG7_9RHOB|nr:hypothetical protein [Roseobacter insulae]MBW4709238.1 hypothetical protein [Roseobacter insulae]